MHLESLPMALPAPAKQESQEANSIESLATVPAKHVKEESREAYSRIAPPKPVKQESREAYSSNSTSQTCQTRKLRGLR